MMKNLKQHRAFRVFLTLFALIFACSLLPAPTASATQVQSGAIVATDSTSDAYSRIKGDPEGGKQDIHAANLYLPVLRWNGLAGNYHSRYSSDAWDRGDAESSGLSTIARSVLQFGDALWSFTATTVNLSSSVDIYGSVGQKIDRVLSTISRSLFTGGGKAGAASIVALIMAANIFYAFSQSRKTGGFLPIKGLLGKIGIAGFIAFLVFGSAAGLSPSERVVGGVIKIVDTVGTSVANTADSTLKAVNEGSSPNLAAKGKSGCDNYVDAMHARYKEQEGPKQNRNSSVIIDSLSQMWESSAIPVWQRIQFRTVDGGKEEVDISNTWCHTAESLMGQSNARQRYIMMRSGNAPDTTGKKGYYAFASGVAGGSVNRDQATIFWSACENQGATWKVKNKELLKDPDKGDKACQEFWDGSADDKNLDPNAKTPFKTAKDASAKAWQNTVNSTRGQAAGDVVRGAKSFQEWCDKKKTDKSDGKNRENEAQLMATWADEYLSELSGSKKMGQAGLRDYVCGTGNQNNTSRTFTSKTQTDNSKMLGSIAAKGMKKKNKDLNEKEAASNLAEVLTMSCDQGNRRGLGVFSEETIYGNYALVDFCQLNKFDPEQGNEKTSGALANDNRGGEAFDWSPSDSEALSQLAEKGPNSESAAAFIQSVQSPNWGAGLYGIAVLYLISSAIIFVIFTAMGLSILIAKAALMLMMLALGLMLIPALIPGVQTGEKTKKVFITLIGFAGVAAVMLLAVSLATIISKIMVDTGVSILPKNSSFTVLWAGIAPGATILGLNMLLKKVGMPSPFSIKGALSWGSSGGAMLKGAMTGAAAARAASSGSGLASRIGSSIGRSRRNKKLANAINKQNKGSKNAEPEPLPAKNSQAAWNKKSPIGRGFARAKMKARNAVVNRYNKWTQNSRLGRKFAWANSAFAAEWNATKGQRGIWRLGAATKAWVGSTRASRRGGDAQSEYYEKVINRRKAKQEMPSPVKPVSPIMPPDNPPDEQPKGGDDTPVPSPNEPPRRKPEVHFPPDDTDAPKPEPPPKYRYPVPDGASPKVKYPWEFIDGQ